jgi:hypothetical protein
VVSSVTPGINRGNTLIWPRPLPFKFFHIYYSAIILSFDDVELRCKYYVDIEPKCSSSRSQKSVTGSNIELNSIQIVHNLRISPYWHIFIVCLIAYFFINVQAMLKQGNLSLSLNIKHYAMKTYKVVDA